MFKVMTKKSIDKLTHRYYDAGIKNGFNRGVLFVMQFNIKESVRDIEDVQDGQATVSDVEHFLRRE